MGGLISAKFLLVLVIALVVLGPEKLPEATRTMGRWLAEFRRVSSGFTEEVRQAFDASDLAQPVQELRSASQALRGTTTGWGGAALGWMAGSPGAPATTSSPGTGSAGGADSGADGGGAQTSGGPVAAVRRPAAGGWSSPPEAEFGIPPGDPSLN